MGKEVLDQCIKHHYIHHIYVLTRKPLDTKYSTHAKITVIEHENFDEMPDHLFERLRGWGVQGCIWTVGPRAPLANRDETQKVGVKYPIQAAEAFAKHVAPDVMESQTGKNIKPFRFVFISCWGAEENQFRQLWTWSEFRKMKGLAEKGLFDVAASSQEIDGRKCLEVISLRAGSVMAGGEAVSSIIYMGTSQSITVDRLARQAIRVVLDGDYDGRKILENKDCLGDDWASINSLAI